MPNITHNINLLLEQMSRIAENCGRDPRDIQLLAVSKTRTTTEIREAFNAGLSAFGENYLQEALDKIDELSGLAIDWHFIGPIQSNKTRPVAEHFAWVHTVDRLKIARRLSEQRPAHLPPLNICLQVNIDGETSKSGVAPDEVETLARAVAQLPNLRLRGLMAIPAPSDDGEAQRQPFFRLRQLLDTLRAGAPALADLDTLSMGMSADMTAAIAEGATIVRIGTAIFGPRS